MTFDLTRAAGLTFDLIRAAGLTFDLSAQQPAFTNFSSCYGLILWINLAQHPACSEYPSTISIILIVNNQKCLSVGVTQKTPRGGRQTSSSTGDMAK